MGQGCAGGLVTRWGHSRSRCVARRRAVTRGGVDWLVQEVPTAQLPARGSASKTALQTAVATARRDAPVP
jgi:hypothetical protein